MTETESSVIVAAKDLISEIIKEQFDISFKIARSITDETNLKSARQNAFVSLLTADGKFNEKNAKTVRYKEVEDHYSILVRGSRNIPIEVRVFGKNESETDRILETILSYMPRYWKIGQRSGEIEILSEHDADYSSNYKDGSMQSAFILFIMDIGKKPAKITTIKDIKLSEAKYE